MNLFSFFRQGWYENDTQHKMINSSDHLAKSTRLIIENGCPEQCSKPMFIDTHINHAVAVTKIYHFEIQITITISKLNEILRLLPDVTSLKLKSLSVSQPGCLSKDEIEFLSFLSPKKQITKIYLENMTQMEELFMLVLICSRINHLQINCINYMYVELLAGHILMEMKTEPVNHSLRLLCFCVAAADDNMVEKLEKMIHVKNLHGDFMIKRIEDNICLEWK